MKFSTSLKPSSLTMLMSRRFTQVHRANKHVRYMSLARLAARAVGRGSWRTAECRDFRLRWRRCASLGLAVLESQVRKQVWRGPASIILEMAFAEDADGNGFAVHCLERKVLPHLRPAVTEGSRRREFWWLVQVVALRLVAACTWHLRPFGDRLSRLHAHAQKPKLLKGKTNLECPRLFNEAWLSNRQAGGKSALLSVPGTHAVDRRASRSTIGVIRVCRLISAMRSIAAGQRSGPAGSVRSRLRFSCRKVKSALPSTIRTTKLFVRFSDIRLFGNIRTIRFNPSFTGSPQEQWLGT